LQLVNEARGGFAINGMPDGKHHTASLNVGIPATKKKNKPVF
jgi:hypothetical protein